MNNPKQEAESIIDALFEEYGTGGRTDRDVPFIDGRDAIKEMKEKNIPGWQEVEWAGYHVKHLVQQICQEKLHGKIQSYDSKKRHLVKGVYPWDARFKASEKSNVPLGDVQEYEEIIKKSGGIGILILDAIVSYDLNEDFRRWQEELKGGSSNYSLEREIEGRPARRRKTAYMIAKALSYFLTLDDLKLGVRDGWLSDTFQQTMRNADGSVRNPKYLLKIDKVPKKYLLFVKNFNEDPQEFDEEYPN